MSPIQPIHRTWLNTGDQAFEAMIGLINQSAHSIRLEVYIFNPGALADRFLQALVAAATRGVAVRVLIDAWGSQDLSDNFWSPLIAVGGQFRRFNPLSLRGLTFRDHRKLLVCDEKFAVVGGFNIAPEYEGDGILRGWRDIGLHTSGQETAGLAEAFDEMWDSANSPHPWFMRLRRSLTPRNSTNDPGRVLLGSPGRGSHPIKRNLVRDLQTARDVRIMAAYYLPTLKIRRALRRVVRKGGRVRLLLPARSDVPASQQATRFLYRKLLQAGMEIYEYQPQILHAKLILIDDLIYVGSSNLDTRSLNINYEIMLRIRDEGLAREARALFDADLPRSNPILASEWRKSRSIWRKMREAWSYFLLARLDLFFARKMWRSIR